MAGRVAAAGKLRTGRIRKRFSATGWKCAAHGPILVAMVFKVTLHGHLTLVFGQVFLPAHAAAH